MHGSHGKQHQRILSEYPEADKQEKGPIDPAKSPFQAQSAGLEGGKKVGKLCWKKEKKGLPILGSLLFNIQNSLFTLKRDLIFSSWLLFSWRFSS